MPYDRHRQRYVKLKRPPAPDTPDLRYEWEKAAWVEAHPNATPREYELAIQAICRRLGY